jgi:hypothetical protein
MNGSIKLAIACTLMAFGQQLAAQPDAAVVALNQQDLRLATIGERMLAANRDLCRRHMPLTGIVLHTKDQYGSGDTGDAFANGRVAIAAIVPGSAASAALVAGDGIAAIGPIRTDTLESDDKVKLRDSAFELLADQPDGAPLALTIARGGREQPVTLTVPTGCRALVEILATSALNAKSDGKVIQVNYGIAVDATDEQLAVVFAHELGHLVLEHRRRLSSEGVKKGLLGEFGRSRRLNREAEIEADQIAVHLLANAGYNPAIAPAFWRSKLGRSTDAWIFRSFTTLSPEGRAELMEEEIATYLTGHTGPSVPRHLLDRRDVPFD